MVALAVTTITSINKMSFGYLTGLLWGYSVSAVRTQIHPFKPCVVSTVFLCLCCWTLLCNRWLHFYHEQYRIQKFAGSQIQAMNKPLTKHKFLTSAQTKVSFFAAWKYPDAIWVRHAFLVHTLANRKLPIRYMSFAYCDWKHAMTMFFLQIKTINQGGFPYKTQLIWI